MRFDITWFIVVMNMNYTGHPYIDIQPHNDFFAVTFYENGSLRSEKVQKSKVTGKEFETESQGLHWAQIILSIARTKQVGFHKKTWLEQTPILREVIANTTKEELDKHWNEYMSDNESEK